MPLILLWTSECSCTGTSGLPQSSGPFPGPPECLLHRLPQQGERESLKSTDGHRTADYRNDRPPNISRCSARRLSVPCVGRRTKKKVKYGKMVLLDHRNMLPRLQTDKITPEEMPHPGIHSPKKPADAPNLTLVLPESSDRRLTETPALSSLVRTHGEGIPKDLSYLLPRGCGDQNRTRASSGIR